VLVYPLSELTVRHHVEAKSVTQAYLRDMEMMNAPRLLRRAAFRQLLDFKDHDFFARALVTVVKQHCRLGITW